MQILASNHGSPHREPPGPGLFIPGSSGSEWLEFPIPLATRGDLIAFLSRLTAQVRADHYMLVTAIQDRDRSDAHIVASNWVYDAIQLAGHGLIARLVQGMVAAAPGERPLPLRMSQAPALPGVLDGEEAKLLDVLGHGEIFSLKLNVGRQRLFLLVSAGSPDRIDAARLGRAQIECCYALSQVPALLAADATRDPLSDRERECLFWVAEGKTTDEIAIILAVSANTVNSYLTHAIQKLSASNRAMAIATAIRNGIL